jgi:tryptophanyl-tRNA synthetase
MKTIFSGMQPTGMLHIGNYLGALKNWVALQNSGQYRCYFAIVDLHSMTLNFEAKLLKERVKNLALDYLSCGLDPAKSTILIQSHLPEHTYLSWIFSALVPIAELKRMHQFKEKTADGEESSINAGLFTYPILMAADILLYKADTVPVGEDQVQHVELARVIAKKFNYTFGQTFPEPEVLLTPTPRVMSLSEPTKKMSKSKGEKNYIALSDPPDVIRRKIMSAVTDVGPTPSANGARSKTMSPGVKNLFTLLESFAVDQSIYNELKKSYSRNTLKYVDLKSIVAEEIIRTLKPIQEKRKELERDSEKVAEILIEGTKQARKVAEQNLAEVKEKTGLV